MTDLHAFSCFDGDECTIVVFTKTRGQARVRAARKFDCGFTEIARVCRAPEFDKHSPGPVPQQAYLDAGWWLYCDGCEAHVTSDDPDRPPIVVRDTTHFVSETVYCSQSCYDSRNARAASKGAVA